MSPGHQVINFYETKLSSLEFFFYSVFSFCTWVCLCVCVCVHVRVSLRVCICMCFICLCLYMSISLSESFFGTLPVLDYSICLLCLSDYSIRSMSRFVLCNVGWTTVLQRGNSLVTSIYFKVISCDDLRGQRASARGQVHSQLITNFYKSVSHNSSMHPIVCPSNLSKYLEELITDNPWSPVWVSLPSLLNLPPFLSQPPLPPEAPALLLPPPQLASH